MTDRPILFSGPMVRALLDGTKTQTRRICKTPPTLDGNGHVLWTDGCPFGGRGDRLWVRETFVLEDPREYLDSTFEIPTDRPIHRGLNAEDLVESVLIPHYRATEPEPHIVSEDVPDDDRCDVTRWQPSIFMPRWASRIILEITDVRVQRLQDISEEDAKAEGVRVPVSEDGHPLVCLTGKNPVTRFVDLAGAAFPDKLIRAYYASLWCDINGAGSWDANPWVWAITFRRITP